MKSEFQFDSAQDLSPEIIQAVKAQFGNRAIKITIEDTTAKTQSSTNSNNNSEGKYSKELTDSVIDFIFDQLSKSGKK